MEEPMEADVEEVDQEAYVGEAPPTQDLVPEQVSVPWENLPVAPGFWAGGPSNQVARREPATSSRARGKAPTVQVE